MVTPCWRRPATTCSDGRTLLKPLFGEPLAARGLPTRRRAGDVFNEVRCHGGPCQVLGEVLCCAHVLRTAPEDEIGLC